MYDKHIDMKKETVVKYFKDRYYQSHAGIYINRSNGKSISHSKKVIARRKARYFVNCAMLMSDDRLGVDNGNGSLIFGIKW
jgi:hypothetical protein